METKWKQNCEVASKECAMLPPSPPSSPLLSLPSSLIPPPTFFFCFPGVYCHWCVFVCLCTCTIVPLCVCVCEHANPCKRENPESWPPDKWPPSPPKLPVAETIKKSRQCCTHTKKGEKRTGDEEPSGEREQGRRTRPAVSSTMRTRAWQRLKAAPYECL